MYGQTKRPFMFRKFMDGDIGAILLSEDTNYYQPVWLYHAGQSPTMVDYATTLMSSKPAKDEEILPLLRELERTFFSIRVINKRQKR